MSNLHTDEYPKFIINESKIIIHGGLSGKSETTFTSDFKNKQLFLWICYNSTLNLYKMALCNYSSRVTKTVPKEIDRHQGVRFDYDLYVNKIGFPKRFIDIDSPEYHKITLAEKKMEAIFNKFI